MKDKDKFRLKRLTQTRTPKLGHYVGEFATPGIGHLLASAGCDYVFFDLEHSGFSIETLKQAIRYFEAAGIPMIVRSPTKDHDVIARICDAGAEGVMVPMVKDAAEAARTVHHLKYPPDGGRGIALGIAHDNYRFGGVPVSERLEDANRRTTFFALIETRDGAENAEEIAGTPGVDCLWIGHFDLTASLGIPGQFDHPDYLAAQNRIIQAAKTNNRSLGRLVGSSQEGLAFLRKGFDFCCYSTDTALYQGALIAGLNEIRGESMAHDCFRVALSAGFRATDGSMTYPSFDLAPLSETEGVEVRFLSPRDPVRAEQLDDVDALILLGERITAKSIPGSGRLIVVARFGVGYDTVDVDACTRNDIAVCITPDGVRRPVAASILTLMLALTGKLLIKDRLVRQGADGFAARSEHMGVGLVGRTLGSLGIGNIGAELFRLAAPLGMKFIACDPYADRSLASELGVDLVDLDTLFALSDVVSINCPLTPDTHHLVDADRLSQMKATAFLINTARGPIVDQAALTEALQDGRIAGAGLDVLEEEPPATDDPILALDNVILTPHALCWTDQCFAGIGAADVASVLDVRAGRMPAGLVNREVTGRTGFRGKLAAHLTRTK